MSTIDRQRYDAVTILERVGYRWNGTAWEIPPAAALPKARQLSLVDLGDMMARRLMSVDGANEQDAARILWLIEAWETATGLNARHGPKNAGGESESGSGSGR